MEVKGKIIARLDVKGGVSKTGNEWKSVEYVVEEQVEKYPKKVCFRVFGDNEKVNRALNALRKDVEATVYFDINAREYNGRWFNDVTAWKVVVDGIDVLSGNAVEQPNSAQGTGAENANIPNNGKAVDAFSEQGNGGGSGDDDVPF